MWQHLYFWFLELSQFSVLFFGGGGMLHILQGRTQSQDGETNVILCYQTVAFSKRCKENLFNNNSSENTIFDKHQVVPVGQTCLSVFDHLSPICLTIWTIGLPWGSIQSIQSEWEACDWGSSSQPDPVLPPPALWTQPRPAPRAAAQSGQMVPAQPSFFFYIYMSVLIIWIKQQYMHLQYMAKKMWTQVSSHFCIVLVRDFLCMIYWQWF